MSSHVRKADVDPGAVTVALHGQSHEHPCLRTMGERGRDVGAILVLLPFNTSGWKRKVGWGQMGRMQSR